MMSLRRPLRPSRWTFALLLPVIRGQDVTTSAPDLSQYYYADVTEPGGCTQLSTCRLKDSEPQYDNRGICVVTTGSGSACWDVCNPTHEVTDYQVVANPADALQNHIVQGMVSQVRQGLNSNVTCPPELNLDTATDPCPPGELCSNKMRHEFDIKRGQGMCVGEPGNDGSRTCLDMCDFRIQPDRFGIGAQMGASVKVMEFRSSGACNSIAGWIGWLIFVLILLLLISCCGVFYYYRRKGGLGFGKGRPSEFKQDLNENAGAEEDELPPFEDQGDQYYDGENEYGANPPVAPVGQFQAPRYGAPPPQSFRERPPSMGQPESPSMRIPGLDEPHLAMPNMQPLVAPQATAQVASPDMIRAAAPFAPTSISSSAGQVQYRTATAPPPVAFQTQLPTYSTSLAPQPAYSSGSPVAYTSTPAGSIRIGAAPVASAQPVQYLSQPGQRG